MSNSCINQLVVTGSDDALERFRQQARGVWPWREMSDPDDRVSPLEVTKFLKPPHAAINSYQNVGYIWCMAHIGCRSGANEVTLDREPGQLMYGFVTAWTPLGEDVILAMSMQHPNLVFEYEWDEPGNLFDGRLVCSGGVVQEVAASSGDNYVGRLCGDPEDEDDEDKETPI